MTDRADDSRVTAYVLGELNDEQRATFERELEGSPELQAEVAATRNALDAIEQSFAAEAVETMSEGERVALANQARVKALNEVPSKRPTKRSGRGPTVALLSVVAALLLMIGMLPVVQWGRE